MKKTATIILNRNLPAVCDRLYEAIWQKNAGETDIFVVESGSQEDHRSQYCTYWANWPEAMKDGLRVNRGFNYGLLKLWEEGKFKNYDYFFLLVNDTEFEEKPIISTLKKEMEAHPRLGILSPCSRHWGEKQLIKLGETKYFWYVNLLAWYIRREYVQDVMELESPDYMNFLFDGTNFRGYESDTELIVKGYVNDWATAITTKVWVEENEKHLKKKADLIRTERYEENLEKYPKEGKAWLRRKYGFNSRWTMQMYSKFYYEKFFEYYPQLTQYKI